MAKNKSTVRISLLAIASAFFFNPNIMLLDILPDFIGWALLLLAFSPVADSVPHFDDACTAFKRMMWITLARYPAFILMMNIFFTNQTERTIVPLFVLCFGTLELMFGFSAFKALFEGIGYAASRAQCDNAFYLTDSPKRKKAISNKIEKVKKKYESTHGKHLEKKLVKLEGALQSRMPLSFLNYTAYAMLVVKFAAEFLPELTYLSSFDSLGYITPVSVNILTYRKYFVVIAATVALVSGIIFLSRFLRYAKNLEGCTELKQYFMQNSVNTATSSKSLLINRIHYACMLYAVGFALMTDFFSNSLNVIPDFIGYAIMLAASISLIPIVKQKVAVIASGVICTCVSALSWFNIAEFTNKYDFSAVSVHDDAADAFLTTLVLHTAEQICALVFIFLIFAQLKNIAKSYASYKGDSINDYSQNELPLSAVFARKFNIGYIAAVLSSVSSVLLLASRTDSIKTVNRLNTVMYLPRFGWGWILQLVLTVVFAAHTISVIISLRDECNIANQD